MLLGQKPRGPSGQRGAALGRAWRLQGRTRRRGVRRGRAGPSCREPRGPEGRADRPPRRQRGSEEPGQLRSLRAGARPPVTAPRARRAGAVRSADVASQESRSREETARGVDEPRPPAARRAPREAPARAPNGKQAAAEVALARGEVFISSEAHTRDAIRRGVFVPLSCRRSHRSSVGCGFVPGGSCLHFLSYHTRRAGWQGASGPSVSEPAVRPSVPEPPATC